MRLPSPGRPRGSIGRAGALLFCAALASCARENAEAEADAQAQRNVDAYVAAGGWPLGSCNMPYVRGSDRSGKYFDSMIQDAVKDAPAHPEPSLRAFAQAVAASHAPVLECEIGGLDTAHFTEIVARYHGGYIALRKNLPTQAYAMGLSMFQDWFLESGPGMNVPNSVSVYRSWENHADSKKYTPVAGAYYLTYQQVPRGNTSAARIGNAIYAIEGLSCAMQMRDYPAARRYLEGVRPAAVLFDGSQSGADFASLVADGMIIVAAQAGPSPSAAYLAVPEDVRRALWALKGDKTLPFPFSSGKTMADVEMAAKAGTLTALGDYLPAAAYCAAFYPDRDFMPANPLAEKTFYITKDQVP